MSKTIFIFALFISAQLVGQSNHQLFQKSNSISGFGGFSLAFSDKTNPAISGEGAFQFSNFYLGGYGNSTTLNGYIDLTSGYDYKVTSDEGGFILGYVSQTSSGLNLFGECRVGFGEITSRADLAPNIYQEYSDDYVSVSPRIGVGYVFSRFIQVRVFGGYTYAPEVQFDASTYNPSRTIYGISLYLGWFE